MKTTELVIFGMHGGKKPYVHNISSTPVLIHVHLFALRELTNIFNHL